MSALKVIAAVVVLGVTCNGSPLPESQGSTTEKEIGLYNETREETSVKPRTTPRPRSSEPQQPSLRSAAREVGALPAHAATPDVLGPATHKTPGVVGITTHKTPGVVGITTHKTPGVVGITTHKTPGVVGITTHKTPASAKRPTQTFKVTSRKNCSMKRKKDHVVKIHVGTGQVVFFTGACGPKSCVVKKELINGVIEPGTQS